MAVQWLAGVVDTDGQCHPKEICVSSCVQILYEDKNLVALYPNSKLTSDDGRK